MKWFGEIKKERRIRKLEKERWIGEIEKERRLRKVEKERRRIRIIIERVWEEKSCIEGRNNKEKRLRISLIKIT